MLFDLLVKVVLVECRCFQLSNGDVIDYIKKLSTSNRSLMLSNIKPGQQTREKSPRRDLRKGQNQSCHRSTKYQTPRECAEFRYIAIDVNIKGHIHTSNIAKPHPPAGWLTPVINPRPYPPPKHAWRQPRPRPKDLRERAHGIRLSRVQSTSSRARSCRPCCRREPNVR